MPRKRNIVPIIALLALGGCAASKPSTDQMGQAVVAIRDAEQAEAVSMAPVPMRTARDAYSRAEEAERGQQYLLASRLAEEAIVDAKLATATAQAERARLSLDEMRRSQDALRREATH